MQWSSVNNKKNYLLKVDLQIINLFTIVMKIARCVCNGKDSGFGSDPVFIISMGHVEKWVLKKSVKYE